MTYEDFLNFPLQIVGIDLSQTVGETTTYVYDSKISKINEFVIDEMAYSGDEDLTDILPYFVFWFFCQDAATTVFAETGENIQVKKFTTPSMDKQIKNWNTGVDKLRAILGITDTLIDEQIQGTLKEKIQSILDENDISININYLSKRSSL